jgi:septal ring factor EnvC (AmiA/AmiB activator)
VLFPDSNLADRPISTRVPNMQSATAKKLAAVEEKLAELSRLGKKIKKLEKEVASLSKKIEAPKDWRLMVGRLADTKIAREADALGREIRRKQTDL